jgi:hypothetical protein
MDASTMLNVNAYFDTIISSYEAHENLIKCVKENILLFILTKQYNFDYGMPEVYDPPQRYNYRFKAIPYSAVDNPVIGSEFSDPILTYILTVFCYKIKNGHYRHMDKDYIVEYYENFPNNNPNKLGKLLQCFAESPISFKQYNKNKEHYKKNYKDKFEIDEDADYIIKEILKINNSYYLQCKNISFNDLLLYKNVNNFVCLTGTAYIVPPRDETMRHNVNFDVDNYIVQSRIGDHINVLAAIDSIVMNPNIVKNFYKNTTDKLIEDIFSCLSRYQVLIDIGGIFVNYSNNSFIEEYAELPNSKEHVIYFDNGIKIFNCKKKKYVNEDVITNDNAFYFFNNKHITGVDAKNIMNPTAHGLVTITNMTNLRDFSQGIFRMRDIKEGGQIFDIIFNHKFEPIIMKGGCNFDKIGDANFDKIGDAKIGDAKIGDAKIGDAKIGDAKIGDAKIGDAKIGDAKIRQSILNNLKKQQSKINEQNYKILIKQNIFALNKRNTSDPKNIYELYIDPSSSEYSAAKLKFDAFLKENEKYKFTKFNMDSLNIINKNQHASAYIKKLVDLYFTDDIITVQNKQNVLEQKDEQNVEQNVEQKDEQNVEEQVEQKNTALPIDGYVNDTGTIYYDLTYYGLLNVGSEYTYITENMILVTAQCLAESSMVLIYNNTKNILGIVNLEQLNKFLMYNDLKRMNSPQSENNKYTIISLYNGSVYGADMDKHKILHLLKITLELFIRFNDRDRWDISSASLQQLIARLKTNEFDNEYILEKPLNLRFIGRNLFSGSTWAYVHSTYTPTLLQVDTEAQPYDSYVQLEGGSYNPVAYQYSKNVSRNKRRTKSPLNMGGGGKNKINYYDKYIKYKNKYFELKITAQ